MHFVFPNQSDSLTCNLKEHGLLFTVPYQNVNRIKNGTFNTLTVNPKEEKLLYIFLVSKSCRRAFHTY